jgi:hypothetical protein
MTARQNRVLQLDHGELKQVAQKQDDLEMENLST